MTYTKRNALWYSGFWLLLTLWLRFALSESMMAWERHQLFRFSADYLMEFSNNPYPILSYIQAFFTQFYLYPLLGAALIGGLLTLGMGAWQRLTGRYWTGAVWAAFMLPFIPYLNLLWILVWLVLLGGGMLVSLRGLSTGGRLGLTVACGLLGSLLIQENIAFAVVFWGLIGGLQTRSLRNGLYALLAGIAGGGLGIGLILWQGYPLFYTRNLNEWALIQLVLPILYHFPVGFFICPSFFRILTYVGLPVLIGLPLVCLLPHLTGVLKKWIQATVGVLLCGLFGITAYLNLHYQVEDFYLVERLACQNRWAEATDAAEIAFFQRARPGAAGFNRTDLLYGQKRRTKTAAGRLNIKPASFHHTLDESYMADMLKICLLASRKATNRLFAYNGSQYFPLLFPDEILHIPSSYLMALYFTQNGLYAEALHILYDFVTSQRINTAVLEPLLWNSVVVGDYEPCRKFIRLFEQSLFHKDIARHYTAYISDTVQTALKPGIKAARTRLSTHNHIVFGYFPDDNIHFRLKYEGDNAAVYEYALALWIIYKNHIQILAELPKIRQYYQTLPTHIQEAVLACFPIEQLEEVPADIHPGIKARYIAFLQTYGLYVSGFTSFQKIKKNFGDTYWYHSLFNEFKPLTETQPTYSGEQI